MNKRAIIGGVVGAIVYYVWGIMAWMVLPLHDPTMHRFIDEEAVATELEANSVRPGWYSIPSMPESEKGLTEKEKKQVLDSWTERHRNGPVAHVFYSEGAEPMPATMMVRGMIIDMTAAFLAAILLGMSGCRNYAQRFGFVIALGAFAAVTCHMAYWNWMRFPLDYTLGMVLDVLLGWTLVGLIMAAIVKPAVAGELAETTSGGGAAKGTGGAAKGTGGAAKGTGGAAKGKR